MIGLHIARELIEERRDIVIVEKDPEVARRASNDLDCMVLNEDGSRPETLRLAGAADADWFLAMTGTDEVNIVACGLVAAECPKVRTAARVANPFYSSLSKAQREAFGLDVIVSPTAEAADAVDRFIREGFAEAILPLHDGRLQLRAIEAGSLPGLAGSTLAEFRKGAGADLLVAAVVRDKGLVIPRGDFTVEESDSLYMLGTPESLDARCGKVEGLKSTAKKVTIIGATGVCERIIEKLLAQSKRKGLAAFFGPKRRITVLDSSPDATKRLARRFEDIEIVLGDSSDEGLLEQAGIDKSDLVICATASQSFNMITAQLVKTLGARKSVAITLNDRYSALAAYLDVDALLSMKDVVSQAVLAMVRRGNIRTIHQFYEDNVELVELRVSAESPVNGLELAKTDMPKGVLAAYVIKGEELVVPTGATRLEGGDYVGIVSRKGDIPDLEGVFGGLGGS